MKRTQLSAAQRSFFEPCQRWSALPLDTRRKLVVLLAELLAHSPVSPTDPAGASSTAQQSTTPSQETRHDAR
jgi:hypothetical protein